MYQSEPNGLGMRLDEVVKRVVSAERTEIYKTIPSLADRLRRTRQDVDLAVLSAASQEELQDIVSLEDLLRGIRLILVLPDGQPETIAKAHTLYPRFLSYVDGDFRDVAAVLAKMMKSVNSERGVDPRERRTVEVVENTEQTLRLGSDREGKYLTFTLNQEEYGLGILRIKEIIGMMPVTSVPKTPDFVKGVINLRGQVIPVVDLRLRFGMKELEYTERTCIIVVEISGPSGNVVIGVVVDSVSEVLNIKGEDIEDTPTFGTSLDTDFILGMAKIGRGVKILLDIDRVLNAQEVVLLNQAA
jgi:purine-binding chemotaxis protein CheW